MRTAFLRLTLLGLASTTLLNCADGDDLVPDNAGDEVQVDREEGRPLTEPSNGTPSAIAIDYLRGRVGAAADQLVVTSQSKSWRGVTHVRLEQVVDGLRVHGTQVKAAVGTRGELLQVIHRLGPTARPVPAQAVESDALRTALVEHGYGVEPARLRTIKNTTTFAKTPEMYSEPTVERVAYIAGKTLKVGFLVETWSQAENQLDHTLVGGDGRIVWSERRTSNDQYNVFLEDPGKGGQTVVSGPGAGNAESPAGWLGTGSQNTINISGNNVRSYLDAQSNNAPDKGGTSVTNGNFLTAADLGVAPGTTGNRAVAVQNLFYLNNIVHDRLYRHGFNEANGNFQANNFGKGGSGNDAVNAEAQDGGGIDNANFATPPDGQAPRMQMYLWSSSTPSGLVDAGGTSYGAYGSSFGPALTLAGVAGPLALYNDGSGVATDGCEASTTSLTGKVAIVDRGTCNFTVKVMNAQAAGAKAVVIVNNVAGAAFPPSGTERRAKIPSAMVSNLDGAALKGLVGSNGALRKNPAPLLQVDGDLDADIVFHEYGHGLTWRMIGGMSGVYAGAIGEGASDVLAFLINGDDRIGEYSSGSPGGIRSKPYGDHTETYANWTANQVHKDGEIYAAAMWGVYQNYLNAGLTADDVLADFVDGMNFTPATPRPEQMRDGMLTGASLERACLIWRGFAARGFGVGASGTTTPITESFALPAGCE